MRRRTSLAAALALGVTWVASACGIPSDKAPEVVGDAPSDFDQSSGTSAEAFGPELDAVPTVENYLKAAGGNAEGRDDRLNAFTASEKQFSEPSIGIDLLDNISVVTASATGVTSATVTVTGSVVGTYLPDGSVRMNAAPRDYDETFTLQRETLQDLWSISVLPSQAMLDYDQFTAVYEQAPLYFEAAQSELLVPDLRWIYRDLDAELRLRLGWLLGGPLEFARFSARNAIPEGTSGKPVADDGVLRIELSLGEAVEPDTHAAMAAQVAWSLGLDNRFVLIADGEEVFDGSLSDWRGWNAIPADLPETGYFVADDTVWEYDSENVTTESPDHPWVGYQVAGLRQVAVSPEDQIAAVVRTAGVDTLQTGTSSSAMRVITDLSGNLADPQWLSAGTVIVVDDGVPTAIASSGGTVQTLAVGTDVTDLALAADGRRLAYVEDGSAWVAPLSIDADGNIQVGDPRRIGHDITDVTGVAWSSENYLWVAGVRGDDRLFRVALDNSRTDVQSWTLGLEIAQIAANPADPVESNPLNRGEPVLVVANATLYRVQSSGPEEVRNGEQAVAGTAPFTVLQ
ncbi:LpqB family beta-propeller domain-containing protein [Glycomyces harbinensis]|uniref:LpqB family beta-propeller domain-containing protein n=1 Tax=Glycomyces harbinensis TaxID=58114 RepID=UPI0024DE2883|nr:LpqB family beta-propeller domain-containing protein [Glycomyces harbinensis]